MLSAKESNNVMLVTQGVLLHGSAGPVPFDRLRPHRARDRSKMTGNLTAVYATTSLAVALLHATLNKDALSAEFGSCSVHYTLNASAGQLSLPAGIDRWATDQPHRLWTAGYLYFVDEVGFQPADPDPHCTEFYSLGAVIPLSRMPIPAAAGRARWEPLIVIAN